MTAQRSGPRSAAIRVVVVDDHELFRSGLIQILIDRGIDVVGQANRAEEGIRLAETLRPHVVLMDLSMPGMSGVEATQRLHAALPEVQVLVLSAMADDRSVHQAVLAGACGYVLKDSDIEETIEATRAAARGDSPFSPRVAGHLLRRLRSPASEPADASALGLSRRELEILELITRGMDNVEIADRLYLSQHTVKNHVSKILDKLHVENRLQAAVRAVREGLL